MSGFDMLGATYEIIGGIKPRKLIGVNIPTEGTAYTDHDTVERVQRKLSAMGYDPGPFDGIFGSKTSAAIKKMQGVIGAPQTGVIDYGVLMALELPAPANGPKSIVSMLSPSEKQSGAARDPESVDTGEPSFLMKDAFWGLKRWQAGLLGLGTLLVGGGVVAAVWPKRGG